MVAERKEGEGGDVVCACVRVWLTFETVVSGQRAKGRIWEVGRCTKRVVGHLHAGRPTARNARWCVGSCSAHILYRIEKVLSGVRFGRYESVVSVKGAQVWPREWAGAPSSVGCPYSWLLGHFVAVSTA